MRAEALMLLAVIIISPTAVAQRTAELPSKVRSTGWITGIVSTHEGLPLNGVHVMTSWGAYSALTSETGRFKIDNVPAGIYDLQLYRIGYAPAVIKRLLVSPAQEIKVDAVMEPSAVKLDRLVVMASRRVQKITDAPATISSIDESEIGLTAGNSYAPALKTVPGLDFTQVGVTNVLVNARSFNQPLNLRVLFIEDGRTAMIPEQGPPVGAGTVIPKIDLDRVEVLVGPGSALYGPNAINGVVALYTKDARQYPGVSVEVAGGSREFTDVQMRYAGTTGSWGYKVTGEHQQAHEWADVVYYPGVAGSGPIREQGNSFHQNVARGTAALSRYFDNGGRLDMRTGASVHDGLGLYGLGRYRSEDTRYLTYQLQYTSPRWFAQAYAVDSNPGKTINLNTFSQNLVQYSDLSWDSVWERSRFSPAGRIHSLEFRNNFRVGRVLRTGSKMVAGTQIIWGAQLRRDRITSERRILTDRLTGKPIITKETGLYAQLESSLTEALRVVLAGRYDRHSRYTFQLSPKAALLYTAAENTVRITYNRAYRAPTILWTDLYWPNVQPGVGVFGNVIGFDVKDTTQAVIRSYAPLIPETNDTWELGYKGVIARKLYSDVTLYHSHFENFITNAVLIANPSAGTMAYFHHTGQPVTDEPGNPLVVLTFFNVGEATSTGVNAGFRMYWSEHFAMSSSLGLARLNSVRSQPGDPPDAIAFNTSPTRITNSLEFNTSSAGSVLTMRYVNGYDFRGGVHYGHLPGFATLDGQVNFRIANPKLMLTVSANNIFTCVGGSLTPPASGITQGARSAYVRDRNCGLGLKHYELMNMPSIGSMLFLSIRWDE